MTLLEFILRRKYEQQGYGTEYIDDKVPPLLEKFEEYLPFEPIFVMYVSEDYNLVDHDLDDHWVANPGNDTHIYSVPCVKISGDNQVFWVAIAGGYEARFKDKTMLKYGWEKVPTEYLLTEIDLKKVA